MEQINDTPARFPVGTRVRIQGHWEWPDGVTGIIVLYPDFAQHLGTTAPGALRDEFIAAGLARRMRGRSGFIVTQWVEFDVPADDGSGDGPYRGGEVDVKNLVLLGTRRRSCH